MKITAEVSGPPQYGQASPYYIDNDPKSHYYGDLYVLVQDASGWYSAMSMTRTTVRGAVGISRAAGWHKTVEEAIVAPGFSPLVPILPPRKITIEIKP